MRKLHTKDGARGGILDPNTSAVRFDGEFAEGQAEPMAAALKDAGI
jgi:hypothetical protein